VSGSTRLVGFAGPIGAGKNAAAIEWGAHVIIEHSDPIYAALAAMIGVSPQWLRDHKDEPVEWLPGRPTVRFLLATMGTEWGREIVSEDLWVELAASRIAIALDSGAMVGVPGVRFLNEAESIRRMGGVVVWIHRPGVAQARGHSSERSISPADCDWIVSNSGSRKALALGVRAAISAIESARQ
jgi:hypothetical protein